MSALPYLRGYAPELLAKVQQLIAEGTLRESVLRRYPQTHDVRSDRALFDYVAALKAEHLRNAEPLAKVAYDNKLQVLRNALGTHTTVSRVQGTKLKAKREIRVASVFKDAPAEFLKMIVVHELAHLESARARQSLLCAVHAHGTRVSPTGVRRAAVADGEGLSRVTRSS